MLTLDIIQENQKDSLNRLKVEFCIFFLLDTWIVFMVIVTESAQNLEIINYNLFRAYELPMSCITSNVMLTQS